MNWFSVFWRIAFISTLSIVSIFGASQNTYGLDCVTKTGVNWTTDHWSEAAEAVVRASALKAPEASRLYVLNAIALHDSYNLTQLQPAYLVKTDPSLRGVPAARVMANASYELLSLEYPSTRPLLDVFYLKQFCHSAEQNERYYAKRFAEQISLKAPIPDETIHTVQRFGRIGEWVLTAPAFEDPVLPHWALGNPLELYSADQFRPTGPPSLTSKEYSAAFYQVKILGNHSHNLKARQKAEIAQFWSDGHRTATGPGHWNIIARQVSADFMPNKRLRLLLALNIAMYDAGVAAWDAKYTYNFWRPVTAIQIAEKDGNPRTRQHSNWFSFLKSPYHPEYVSGHSTFSAAAATILEESFGTMEFCAASEGVSQYEKRCFASFTQAAEEAGMSRIYGGIHFSFSNKDGLKLGRDVGNWTLQSLAKKLSEPK